MIEIVGTYLGLLLAAVESDSSEDGRPTSIDLINMCWTLGLAAATFYVAIRTRFFQYKYNPAKLEMRRFTDEGHRVSRKNPATHKYETKTWFHIEVKNRSRYIPAKDISILCTKIERSKSESGFDSGTDKEPPYIPGDIPLTWVFRRDPPIQRIYSKDSVDLGYITKENKGEYIFHLSAPHRYYDKDWNLPLEISSNEFKKMRVHLRIESDGWKSKESCVYEIDLSEDLEKKFAGDCPIAKKI